MTICLHVILRNLLSIYLVSFSRRGVYLPSLISRGFLPKIIR